MRMINSIDQKIIDRKEYISILNNICTKFNKDIQQMEQTALSTQEKYRRDNEELWKKTQTLKDTQLSLNLSTGQGSSQGYNLNQTQIASVGPSPRGQMAGEASQHKNKGMYKGVQPIVEYDFFGLNTSTGNECTMVNQSYPNCSSFEINFGEQIANEADLLCDQNYGFMGMNTSTGNESTMANQSYNSSFRPRENPQSGNLKSTPKSEGKKHYSFGHE
ncbi:hypothetical protein Mgra_00003729 [Meloidogyne graminicola]|uniref:Uncharacterized protein n=1 Tax=Meloidogyne graminicola TaxID=189291 RepID=A0A8S9ZUI4_9BILA|nr:hypothetical protein Mgra_00003729 [Meloidogyne graminicola]